MQPVFPYRALSYPPRGSMWPTFGDDVLAKTLTVTEEAHHYLNEKRKMMNDFHQDNLDYHGLQPKKAPETFDMTDDAHAPVESSTAEAGTQMEGQATAGMGTQTQRRPLQMQTGVAASQAPETASTDMEVDREGPPKKTMTYQRGVAAASQAPEKKKLAYQKGVAASIDPAADMEDDRETVNYGEEDMDTSSALEVDDHEMQVPAASRKREAAPEEKKVKKLKPQVQAQTVKTEGQAASMSQAVLTPVGGPEDDDDDLQMTGVNINRSTDMEFWKNQSPREIRTQLNLRNRSRIGDWAFKDKQQLHDIVEEMIKNGTW